MGTAAAATALAVSSAGNIIDGHNQRRYEIKEAKNQRRLAEKRRKNILNEQLAKRRAAISSMGISSTGSVLASQNKLVDDIYEENPLPYKRFSSNLSHYAGMANQVMGNASSSSKMIK